MTTIAIILAVIIIAIIAILAYASTQPDAFRVERSTLIMAPPEAIYPFIADFHRWTAWSPWEHRDPALRRTYSGPEQGLGSIYEWQGNKNVGEGRMEIIEATTPSKIRIKLDFLKPFEAHNTAEFTLSPEGGATALNWAMYGSSPFMAKVMGLFMSMDKMVGKDFEAGLASLKKAAEG